MDDPRLKRRRLAERDLDFLVEIALPEEKETAEFKRQILEDEDLRKYLISDDKVFKTIMEDEEIFVRISSYLYFAILLRKAQKELDKASHTVERTGSQRIPVFDAPEVVKLLANETLLDYLVDMLASFTRVENYVIPIRIAKGIWKKIRFNDMDIDALHRYCEVMDEDLRFSIYKRIGDVCLFVLGIFPEYVYLDYRYPYSGEVRPKIAGHLRRGIEEYEEEGKKFYRMASEHPVAEILHMSDVFLFLHDNFNTAKKPLNFISQHYLVYTKQRLFGMQNQ